MLLISLIDRWIGRKTWDWLKNIVLKRSCCLYKSLGRSVPIKWSSRWQEMAGRCQGVVNNEGFHRSNVTLKNLSSLTIIGTSCDNSPCISGRVPFRVPISGDDWTVTPYIELNTDERVRGIYKFVKEIDRRKGNFIYPLFPHRFCVSIQTRSFLCKYTKVLII